MAKRKQLVKRPKSASVPDFTDSAEWEGAYFSRCKDHAFQYYRLEKKNSDFKRYTLDWVKTSDEWKDKYSVLTKAPENRFNSTLGCLCNLTKQGMPNVHQKYNEYWESLPGTMGTPKPHSEYINKWLNEILDVA